MTQFTKEELNNLLAITNKVSIVGQEALTVALLQKKLTDLIALTTQAPAEEPKKDGEKTG